jgi:putative oxidoreductase
VEDANLALLLLRVVVGVTLAAHGYNKFFGGGRIAGTARWFDSIGMRPGRVHAVVAALGEIAAGLALAAGLLTTPAAAGFVGLMAVAFWVAHRGKGFFVFSDGWEYTAVLAAAAVVIAMLGPGDWSVDQVVGIAGDMDGWVGLAISLGGGLAAAALLLAVFYRPSPSDT